MSFEIPAKQTALQLVGPDEMIINKDKDVIAPGPYQILAKLEAVGLCFSDLKLLKQFSEHARKTEIVSGIEESVLDEVPSYMHTTKPTVPGHEAVVRIVAVGDKVDCVKLGGRYLVQTDYRWLPTEHSNASFGYNFEGGLQDYVLMDQRVITSPEGESMLIPASEELSASAIALVEPWACVEHAFAIRERQTLTAGGKMLVVADAAIDASCFASFLNAFGLPGTITALTAEPLEASEKVTAILNLDEAKDAYYDDVIYYGSNPETAEALFPKVGAKGILNLVQGGQTFGRDVQTQIGRVHYGGIRVVGTTGSDPADSMKRIPEQPEIRPGDNINVIGAAGPMGTMNVIRSICQGIEGTTVYASTRTMDRLEKLNKMAMPFAEKNGVGYVPFCSTDGSLDVVFDYIAIMAPVPELVENSVKEIAREGIINIFAGIPAHVSSPIDLDRYIQEEIYFIGTSGSTLDDMKSVLKKVEAGQLDTNMSIGAICGLNNAIDGIRAVEHQTISGKIIVYSRRADLPLTKLEDLAAVAPEMAEHLTEPKWTKDAENAFLGL